MFLVNTSVRIDILPNLLCGKHVFVFSGNRKRNDSHDHNSCRNMGRSSHSGSLYNGNLCVSEILTLPRKRVYVSGQTNARIKRTHPSSAKWAGKGMITKNRPETNEVFPNFATRMAPRRASFVTRASATDRHTLCSALSQASPEPCEWRAPVESPSLHRQYWTRLAN